MGIRSSAHFTPKSKRVALAPEQIQRLLTDWGAATLSLLESRPLPSLLRNWPAIYESEPTESVKDQQVSKLSSTLAVSPDQVWWGWILGASGVIKPLDQEISSETFPKNLRGDFSIGDMSFTLGYWELRHFDDFHRILAKRKCAITLSGYGNPIDIPQFIVAFEQLPSVVRLMNRLREMSSTEWEIHVEVG